MTKSGEKIIRYSLGGLLIIVALNAFGGGYYGMAGAANVPVEWLHNSLFKTYLVPGFILFTIVGGVTLFAALSVFRKRHGRKAAFISAVTILVWLAVQVSIIGYVSWMQPITAIVAVLIILLAYLLPPDED
jgi:hypothetical protein